MAETAEACAPPKVPSAAELQFNPAFLPARTERSLWAAREKPHVLRQILRTSIAMPRRCAGHRDVSPTSARASLCRSGPRLRQSTLASHLRLRACRPAAMCTWMAPVGPLKTAGMAFQNANPCSWRTTLDNVMLPLETHPTVPPQEGAPSLRSGGPSAAFARVGLRAGLHDRTGSCPVAAACLHLLRAHPPAPPADARTSPFGL